MMMQAHSISVVVHHHGSVSVNKARFAIMKLILQGKGGQLWKISFTSKDLHSLSGCLHELCLKSVTGNKIDHTKLTVMRLQKKMVMSCCVWNCLFGKWVGDQICNLKCSSASCCSLLQKYCLCSESPMRWVEFLGCLGWDFLTYLVNVITIITEETSLNIFLKYAFSTTCMYNYLWLLFAYWEVKQTKLQLSCKLLKTDHLQAR